MAEGRVGAAAGATVGKFAGRGRGSPGGVGSTSGGLGGHTLGALAVVNAFGNVRDGSGRVVGGRAGKTAATGSTPAPSCGKGSAGARRREVARPGASTTLAVVATDAPLSRGELARVVHVAATALPRRIDPVGTHFDGDLVLGLTTARERSTIAAAESLALGVALRDLLEEAITRAVTEGR